MNIKFLIILLFLLPVALWAQSGATPAGGSVRGGEGSLSFTMGSPFVQHTSQQATAGSAPRASLYEGVQQTYRVDELDMDDLESIAAAVEVFPNPAIDKVVIRLSAPIPDLRYEVYTMQGQLLQSGEVSGSQQALDLQQYPSGTYMLRLRDTRGQAENHYKITKKR